MLGLQFDQCNKFALSFSFENCTLDHSSFYQCRIPETSFYKSQLHEVDFTESDLNKAIFTESDLERAIFNQTNLEEVDFSTAYKYSFDLEKNRIRKAIFSIKGIPGLLNKYGIVIND